MSKRESGISEMWRHMIVANEPTLENREWSAKHDYLRVEAECSDLIEHMNQLYQRLLGARALWGAAYNQLHPEAAQREKEDE